MQTLGLTPDLRNQKLGGWAQQAVSPPGDADPIQVRVGDQGRTVSERQSWTGIEAPASRAAPMLSAQCLVPSRPSAKRGASSPTPVSDGCISRTLCCVCHWSSGTVVARDVRALGSQVNAP